MTHLPLLLTAGVLGVMLFFSIAVAPTVFKVLPAEHAGRYVRAFFPRYYFVLGVVTAIAAGFCGLGNVAGMLLGLCAVLFALSLWVLTPATNRATDAGNRRAFAWLHGSTIAISVLQIVLLFVVVGRLQ